MRSTVRSVVRLIDAQVRPDNATCGRERPEANLNATTRAGMRKPEFEASDEFDCEIGSKIESEFDSGTDSEFDGV